MIVMVLALCLLGLGILLTPGWGDTTIGSYIAGAIMGSVMGMGIGRCCAPVTALKEPT